MILFCQLNPQSGDANHELICHRSFSFVPSTQGRCLPPDFCTTFNASQDGVYLTTSASHYAPGVNVYLTSDFQTGSPMTYAMAGVVVRVDKLEGDKWGINRNDDIFSPSSLTVQ